MHPDRRLRLSKFLSLVLRHRPEEVGVTLDDRGRVPLQVLVEAIRVHGREEITAQDITEVAGNDPRRFELCDGMIRARYGHSLPVSRPGAPIRPPEWLYVGIPPEEIAPTAQRGVTPGSRSHVHLCDTPDEAFRTFQRRGAPAALVIVLARRAHDAGVPFYQAAARLYLAPGVEPAHLLIPAG